MENHFTQTRNLGKMHQQVIAWFLFIMLSLTSSGCSDELAAECACRQDVARVCTYDYRILSLTLKDASQNPVQLDEYSLTELTTDKVVFKVTDPINADKGLYTLLEDKDKALTTPCGKEFRFVGLKDYHVAVDTVLTIAQDCCHIQFLNGNNALTVVTSVERN